MTRILYLSHMDIRGRRAHVHNVLKTCEALQKAGNAVTLVSADVSPNQEDLLSIFARHAITTAFPLIFLATVPIEKINDPARLTRWWALMRTQASLFRYAFANRSAFDVLYYRYHPFYPVAWLVRHVLGKKVLFECHYVYIANRKQQWLTERSVFGADRVVAITQALCDHYKLPADRCLSAPCHAAEGELVPRETSGALRAELGLPLDKKILCYSGSIGATIQGISYEVETMVTVLKNLPPSYVSLVIGGRGDKAEQELRSLARASGVEDRLMIRPWCDRAMLMKYLSASDVLLMPRVGTAPGSSPSKMFDYLAVGKPIVAAQTPPVMEILHDNENSLLVDADKKEEWTAAIERIQSDPALASHLIQGARETAKKYTWTERGIKIEAFIRHGGS